jgi:iron complex transport system substrate-binding protein
MPGFLLALLFALPCLKAAAVSVEDFAGRTVTLEKPAQRIVALAPHTVENLFSAGAGDRLVGAVSYSNYPARASDVPRVGSYNAYSLEQILALRPDLVLMWQSGNGTQTLDQLERLGIPVYVSELRQLPDIALSIRRLATLAGTEAAGELEARRIETELARLGSSYSNQRPIRVLYQIWNEPLQTVNGDHLISQVIALCGGSNIFAGTAGLAPRISVEAVLQRNPEAILASGMDKARPEWLDQWRTYPSIDAVANQALFFVDPDHIQRPTARILLGANKLCGQLQSLRP